MVLPGWKALFTEQPAEKLPGRAERLWKMRQRPQRPAGFRAELSQESHENFEKTISVWAVDISSFIL